jgi:hypothetical protein
LILDEQIAAKSEPTPASKPVAPAIPDPWGALRIGAHVVANDWDERDEAIGLWSGTITGFDNNDFAIVWRDEPNTAPLKIARKHIAILHPSFDVKSEWDRKPTRRNQALTSSTKWDGLWAAPIRFRAPQRLAGANISVNNRK